GAGRSPRWIRYAAKEAKGWTPSGRFSSWDDLEFGMKIYREAGGTNAVLANCSIDLAERPQSAELAKVASVNFICPPEEARRRIKRVEQFGFEEILIGSPFGALEGVERVRDFVSEFSARAPFHPRRRLLRLVGVEHRGDALGIGGERRDAGALDLQ